MVKKKAHMDNIITVNNVELRASEERVYFGDISLSFRWGEYYNCAGICNSIFKYAEEFGKMSTVGYLFNCVRGASSYWLWKKTNDTIVSPRTLEKVSNMDYKYDYGLADTFGAEVVESIYSYIEGDKKVQDNIIESRCNNISDKDSISEVHILNPHKYTGRIEITGVLFDDEDEREFYKEAEDMTWLDNPEDYVTQIFEKSLVREDNTVVCPDHYYSKPTIKNLYEIVLFERESYCLSKIVETAPYREDLSVRFDANYSDNVLEIQIS
jgi:hypothetical protein